MKKVVLLLMTIVVFSSCLNDDDGPNYTYEFITIDAAETPDSFTFGEKDTITLKYTFKNECYNFDNIYYEYQDTARVVAVKAFIDLDKTCSEDDEPIEKEYKLVVNVQQKEDYLFKFFKGKDDEGENIFEEVAIPVN